MFAVLHSLAMFIIDFFKSPRRLEAENLFLRHQLSIALSHDYYARKHMPMVMERLKGSGMLRYEVDEGLAGGGP